MSRTGISTTGKRELASYLEYDSVRTQLLTLSLCITASFFLHEHIESSSLLVIFRGFPDVLAGPLKHSIEMNTQLNSSRREVFAPNFKQFSSNGAYSKNKL